MLIHSSLSKPTGEYRMGADLFCFFFWGGGGIFFWGGSVGFVPAFFPAHVVWLGGVFVVVMFLFWCFCGGVVVLLCFCGGVFVVVWWCFCVFVVVFWWCFCGVFVVVF